MLYSVVTRRGGGEGTKSYNMHQHPFNPLMHANHRGIQINEGLLQSVTERWGLAPKPARVE